MSITIKDLAKHLDLSITTVSRALDGYDDVAEETRQRVVKAADEIGYIPSAAARQLRRQRSDAIGFIMAAASPRFNDPMYVSMISGLSDEAATRRMDMVLSSAAPDTEEEKNIYRRWVAGRRVDGMILNRIRQQDWRAEYLAKYHMPFVAVGQTESAVEYPCVVIENSAGFASLVAHVVDRGHQRIAYVGGSNILVSNQECVEGYRQGLEAAGLSFDPDLVVSLETTEEAAYAAAIELLSRPNAPTALLCFSDTMAIGAMAAAKERGLKVGKDLAVAGYGNIERSQYSTPTLTTLNYPSYEIARHLAATLLHIICKEPVEQESVKFPIELVVRESTG